MKKKNINILLEKNRRLKNLKTELICKILKSLLQCNNTPNLKKKYALYYLTKYYKNIKKHETKTIKTCLVTGKRGGSLKNFNFSRHCIKKYIGYNQIDNLKNFE
jgi:ribosomal protein S14